MAKPTHLGVLIAHIGYSDGGRDLVPYLDPEVVLSWREGFIVHCYQNESRIGKEIGDCDTTLGLFLIIIRARIIFLAVA